MIEEFLTEARTYCKKRGIKLGVLGYYAVNNSKLLPHLAGGGDCQVRTIERVRKYMRDNPPPEAATEKNLNHGRTMADAVPPAKTKRIA